MGRYLGLKHEIKMVRLTYVSVLACDWSVVRRLLIIIT